MEMDYNLITKKGINYRYGIDGYGAYNITGYADYYLVECWNETKLINEANVSVYRQLVDIDTKLGTSTSSQLSCCLNRTTRRDIIEVNLFFVNRFSKYSRLSILNRLINSMNTEERAI